VHFWHYFAQPSRLLGGVARPPSAFFMAMPVENTSALISVQATFTATEKPLARL